MQLNKKYNFLENARCCIDLCAAPGGWLQVASKHMPPNSLIVGVDLVPIRPIPRCITFAEDINSYKCRDQLRAHLKDWKADVVMHDGAPNVGTAWVQDAYAQSELTLQALKLAVEFLAPGGTFVTKVFRSKDYNNLIWVFNQLFHHVEATKPPSSRNVSAEIFVVCERFKNLSRIDPKFLDPRYVFKDLEPLRGNDMTGTSSQNLLENVVNPEKARRKREGYEEGNYTLYKTISAHDFIHGSDAVAILGTYNRITFSSEADKPILENPATNDEVKADCEDLKLLGRGEFSILMKWRKKVRESIGLGRKQNEPAAEPANHVEVEPLNEEEAIDEELARLNEESSKRARKERRRRNEARAKAIQKLQLNMTTPMDMGQDWTDEALQGGAEDVFALDPVERGRKGRQNVQLLDDEGNVDAEDAEEPQPATDVAEPDEDEDEDEDKRYRDMERDLDSMYERYQEERLNRDTKARAKEARRNSSKYEEWGGIDNKPAGSDDEDSAGEGTGGYDDATRRKFHEETYDSDDAEDDEDEREEMDVEPAQQPAPAPKKRKADPALLTSLESQPERQARESAESAMWFDNPIFKDMVPLENFAQKPANGASPPKENSTPELESTHDSEDEDDEEEEEDGDDDFEVVPREQVDVPEGQWDVRDEDQDAARRAQIEKYGLNTAEAVSMAQALVNRQMTKSDLVDQGFSKQNFNDKDDLPSWFLDDERKSYPTNLPVTKEAMASLRAKQRALDARPIKKVAEAKARKKYKAAKRLENAQKRAEAINENSELTEREKAENIDKVMAKSLRNSGKQRPNVQLVVAKGANRGIRGRPKGTKGRYKMVDARMKKDLRAQSTYRQHGWFELTDAERIAKRDGKKRSSSHKRPRRVPNGY